jgi:hypothetical protein
VGLLYQAPLQRGFASIVGMGPHQQAGYGEPLWTYGPNASGDPERESRERLACLGAVVLGRQQFPLIAL